MVAVLLEQLSKTYRGGVRAVTDLDLTVAAGELLVLVGPSGCGKTTTLRLIAGLEVPDAGRVHIGSRVANDVPPWRRDVALAFQRPALYPHRDVRANLGIGLALSQGPSWPARAAGWFAPRLGRSHRAWRAERDARVMAAARTLNLEDLLDRFPGQLSGGEQQRVALGRALVRRPGVLLLDEPLSNLDARHRQELRHQLLLLHRRLPATMIYVTHDPGEAMSLGDRVAVLRDGALQQVGRPQEVYERPGNRFVAGFLGWPPMSFLEGELLAEAGRLWLVGPAGKIALPAGWSGRSRRGAVLGIRPEDIQLTQGAATGPLPGDAALEMVVSFREPYGALAVIGCARASWQVTGLEIGGNGPKLAEGQKVTVVLRLAKAHLFDAIGGQDLLVEDRSG